MTGANFSRRHLLAGTTGLAASAVFGSGAQVAFAQGQRVLNARMQRDMSILDPGYMVGGAEIDIQNALMPRLVEYSYEGGRLGWTPTPHVAQIAQRDPLHIEFELKPGFQWSNGFGEVTAVDVQYSLMRLLESDWSGDWEALESVELNGEYSGTIVLKRPFVPIWLSALCGSTGYIVSKAATESVGGKYTTEIPATSGPYVYDWTPKQRIVFTRNPDWIGPAPYFDQVNYIVVEEDRAAELAYEAGEVDIALITPATVARYTANPPANSKLRVAGALQYMWLGMNTEHPKLQDIRVRQAIQHAIDVDSIIQGAYSGITERAYGIVPPGFVGKRNETALDYNPAKSRELLSAAGMSGLELDLRTLNRQERMLSAQVIQANLADVGIQARVVPMDSGPFWDMGQESKGEAWKDLELWLMRFGSGPDPYEPFQWFVKDQVGVWNWERWSDPEFDDLYDRGLIETDSDERHRIYLRMQEIMENTGAYVWITHESETFVHRDTFEPEISPDGQMNFRNFTPA